MFLNVCILSDEYILDCCILDEEYVSECVNYQ